MTWMILVRDETGNMGTVDGNEHDEQMSFILFEITII